MNKAKNSKFKTKSEVAIKLANVSKKYIIHHEKPTFAERLLNGKGEEFYALKNINLTINKGEKVGIIGANGSGKTTLLKLITGISSPSIGKVETWGKIVSLIDLEAGFHPDLTGIQNIYLSGTLLGMGKQQIDSKLNEIISYANIGKFIDAPLFTYSSGMKLRVGFSVAVHSDPDILILDENISVGDEDFKRISFNTVQQLVKMGKTLIFASHDLDFIRAYCNRAILLFKGKIMNDNLTSRVISNYHKVTS
jgi:ABC-type polysaccharide/polyol phosphate transport system ATPase subunit